MGQLRSRAKNPDSRDAQDAGPDDFAEDPAGAAKHGQALVVLKIFGGQGQDKFKKEDASHQQCHSDDVYPAIEDEERVKIPGMYR
jgi:hypothetical protein